MNRTTDDLLDALLSKQALPEYFEENDAELLRQTLHILIAILVYGAFAIFALAVGLASFSSFSTFVVGPHSFWGRWGAIFLPLTCLISAPGVRWWSGFAIRSNILFTAFASCSAGCCSAFL